MRQRRLRTAACLAVMFCMISPTVPAAESMTDFGGIGSTGNMERPGAMVWMDLLTTDVSRAADFYREILGWDFQFSADGSYAYATLDGRPVAAIAAFEEELDEADGLWIPSLSVSDVDGATRAVASNGGTVIEPPEDLPGRGRYALIEDATGAPLMLLRAKGGDPDRIEAPNQWLWAELWTDDVNAARDFYEAVVGYRTVTVKDPEGQAITVMGRDRRPHASMVETPLPNVDPAWLAYLMIEDINATVLAVVDAGGSVLVAPLKDSFNDNVAIVADPTGGVFALQQKETGR